MGKLKQELKELSIFGKVFGIGTVILFSIYLIDAEAQSRGDFDGDGIPDSQDACPRQPETFNGFEDRDGCPDREPLPTPAQVTINAERVGSRGILVTWKFDSGIKNNDVPYKWILERSLGGRAFVEIATGERDPNNKRIEQSGREVDYYLDKALGLFTHSYRVTITSIDGTERLTTSATTTIEIRQQTGTDLHSRGTLLETTRTITPQPPLLSGLSIPIAIAEVGDPLVTTTINPENEGYLFSLSPIPSPTYNQEGCEQTIEVIHQITQAGGQDIDITITLIENGTATNQDTIGTSDSTNRLYSRNMFIPLSEQVITDFENLEVQLDFNAEFDLNPANHRSMSIYEINYYVPEDNGAC